MFDIPGMLVLVVLILLFGFLATRAWRVNNRLLKWIGVLVAGLLTIIPALIGALAVNGYARLNQRYDNPVPTLKATGSSAQIARGQQLAHICMSCHSTSNQLPLAGTDFLTKFGLPPLGTLYSPNLTPGGNIDGWTDGELVRAIREGISKDGRSLLIMPSSNLRNLSDEDVLALVAYLRSQPPTGSPTPPTRFSLFGAVFTNLVDFRTAQPPAGTVIAPPPAVGAFGTASESVCATRSVTGAHFPYVTLRRAGQCGTQYTNATLRISSLWRNPRRSGAGRRGPARRVRLERENGRFATRAAVQKASRPTAFAWQLLHRP